MTEPATLKRSAVIAD